MSEYDYQPPDSYFDPYMQTIDPYNLSEEQLIALRNNADTAPLDLKALNARLQHLNLLPTRPPTLHDLASAFRTPVDIRPSDSVSMYHAPLSKGGTNVDNDEVFERDSTVSGAPSQSALSQERMTMGSTLGGQTIGNMYTMRDRLERENHQRDLDANAHLVSTSHLATTLTKLEFAETQLRTLQATLIAERVVRSQVEREAEDKHDQVKTYKQELAAAVRALRRSREESKRADEEKKRIVRAYEETSNRLWKYHAELRARDARAKGHEEGFADAWDEFNRWTGDARPIPKDQVLPWRTPNPPAQGWSQQPGYDQPQQMQTPQPQLQLQQVHTPQPQLHSQQTPQFQSQQGTQPYQPQQTPQTQLMPQHTGHTQLQSHQTPYPQSQVGSQFLPQQSQVQPQQSGQPQSQPHQTQPPLQSTPQPLFGQPQISQLSHLQTQPGPHSQPPSFSASHLIQPIGAAQSHPIVPQFQPQTPQQPHLGQSRLTTPHQSQPQYQNQHQSQANTIYSQAPPPSVYPPSQTISYGQVPPPKPHIIQPTPQQWQYPVPPGPSQQASDKSRLLSQYAGSQPPVPPLPSNVSMKTPKPIPKGPSPPNPADSYLDRVEHDSNLKSLLSGAPSKTIRSGSIRQLDDTWEKPLPPVQSSRQPSLQPSSRPRRHSSQSRLESVNHGHHPDGDRYPAFPFKHSRHSSFGSVDPATRPLPASTVGSGLRSPETPRSKVRSRVAGALRTDGDIDELEAIAEEREEVAREMGREIARQVGKEVGREISREMAQSDRGHDRTPQRPRQPPSMPSLRQRPIPVMPAPLNPVRQHHDSLSVPGNSALGLSGVSERRERDPPQAPTINVQPPSRSSRSHTPSKQTTTARQTIIVTEQYSPRQIPLPHPRSQAPTAYTGSPRSHYTTPKQTHHPNISVIDFAINHPLPPSRPLTVVDYKRAATVTTETDPEEPRHAIRRKPAPKEPHRIPLPPSKAPTRARASTYAGTVATIDEVTEEESGRER